MTDTVGFIQKLPTTLIAAFRATLEEITEADLLLHVVDTSHSNVLQHIETVEDTLAEIEMPSIPRILVWNKMDLAIGTDRPERTGKEFYAAEISVSAQTGIGIPELLATVETTILQHHRKVRLLLPYHRGDLVSTLFETANVENQEHVEEGVILTVHLPPELYERYKEYRLPG